MCDRHSTTQRWHDERWKQSHVTTTPRTLPQVVWQTFYNTEMTWWKMKPVTCNYNTKNTATSCVTDILQHSDDMMKDETSHPSLQHQEHCHKLCDRHSTTQRWHNERWNQSHVTTTPRTLPQVVWQTFYNTEMTWWKMKPVTCNYNTKNTATSCVTDILQHSDDMMKDETSDM